MPLVASLTTQAGFDGKDRGEKLIYITFAIVASGTYPTGGDTLDLSQLGLPSAGVPIGPIAINSASASAGHSGYTYYYRPGTTQANGKMQVLTTGSGSGQPLVELSAGAYPAGITADTIIGQAQFVYGL